MYDVILETVFKCVYIVSKLLVSYHRIFSLCYQSLFHCVLPHVVSFILPIFLLLYLITCYCMLLFHCILPHAMFFTLTTFVSLCHTKCCFLYLTNLCFIVSYHKQFPSFPILELLVWLSKSPGTECRNMTNDGFHGFYF